MRKQRGFISILLLLLLLILLAALAYWFFGRSAQPAANQDAAPVVTQTADTNTGYLVISEFGVRFKLPEGVDELIYKIRQFESESTEGQMIKTADMASKALVDAEAKVTTGSNNCTADTAPLGTLSRYQKGDLVRDVPVEQSGSGAVKVGDYYYLYSTPQANCSMDDGVNELAASQLKAVKKAVANLEVAP